MTHETSAKQCLHNLEHLNCDVDHSTAWGQLTKFFHVASANTN
jgi:hypothetical protein